jgi:sulfide:quinone oxidoreductase
MKSKHILFPLAPVYQKKGIVYKQAKAVSFYPEGDSQTPTPYVLAEYVTGENRGQTEKVSYDYLINATGPKLNFEATEGLNPGQNKTYSVCTYTHADHAWEALDSLIKEMKAGKKDKNSDWHRTCKIYLSGCCI